MTSTTTKTIQFSFYSSCRIRIFKLSWSMNNGEVTLLRTVGGQRCEESLSDARFYRELSYPQIMEHPKRMTERQGRRRTLTHNFLIRTLRASITSQLPSTPFSKHLKWPLLVILGWSISKQRDSNIQHTSPPHGASSMVKYGEVPGSD
jgi:hypothetical protein